MLRNESHSETVAGTKLFNERRSERRNRGTTRNQRRKLEQIMKYVTLIEACDGLIAYGPYSESKAIAIACDYLPSFNHLTSQTQVTDSGQTVDVMCLPALRELEPEMGQIELEQYL